MKRNLDAKLNGYLRDAHSMERNVQVMLESMITTTDDPNISNILRRHQRETEQHIERLEARLEARGEGSSTLKDTGAILGSFFKGLADVARSDKAGKNARDCYVTEALEIAAYELLERLAQRAGDEATASTARANKADEEGMRDAIAANWDRFVDLVIEEHASA